MKPCLPVEELARLDALPSEDPRRLHVAGCARCRARWLAFRDFAGNAPLPPDARPADARARLDAVIDRVCAGPQPSAPPADPPPAGPPRPRRAWALAPAAALAVAVLLLARADRLPRLTGADAADTLVLRGGPAGAVPHPAPPRPLPDGAVELRWSAVPGALAYRVRLYGDDLAPLFESPALADTVLLLRRDALPPGPASARPLVWRVAAVLPAGESLSPPGLLRLP